MFTGIIKILASVDSFNDHRLVLKLPSGAIESIEVGDSVAINGVCLTASELDAKSSIASFDLSDETLERTTLGKIERSQSVNVELALAIGDRMGGHWLQGHVDAVGELVGVVARPDSKTYSFQVDPEFDDLTVEKGSIAVDGISLTPFNVVAGRFDTAIIPHTYDETTLKSLVPGDKVNIEFDIVGKYIRKQLRKET